MGMFLLCTFLMIILYPLGIDLYLVAVPRIAQTLQGSEAQIHTAFSIYLLGMAATVLPGGMLADRHGRRPVVLGGALIFVVASLVAAEATGIAQFYLGRFWQGVGAGALYIMTFTVLRDVLSQARLAMALSLINGVICVIPVLAPVLGYLILSHFEWRGIFVGMALVAAISALVNLRLLKETRPARQPAGASPLALLGTAPFMLRALLTSASVTAILVYVSVSPLVLMTTFGLPPEQYTRLMMAMAGVSMSASFLTPLLLRWLGKARVLALSHLAYLLAGFALVCIGFSCGFGVAMGEALDVCGDQVASASALLCIMQIGLSGLFIWGMGHLGMPALWMLILALLLALLGYLMVKVLLPWRAVRRVRARG
ncbi:MdtL family multidrug efflux MFS transporter [Aeromonas caviae]|uniref:MdtL family multidrug efflux MFS transporter n=1 Tax=Aeromonas TaxID=642 RepID=UPI001495598B|nr:MULTISPECIES: MdtL family multidrug efflux MFS transporter [Aeromonas]MBA8782584.1 MdtL family multidrug efflux MFS transporter [Aeromonas caviae]MBA8786639.1 MdtL family multidrug efflux MFS transporter [Aeromonas sp. TW 6]MBL0549454.1 MdtL family multidrug efflux MFS transporter [Aeromonas caviae]